MAASSNTTAACAGCAVQLSGYALYLQLQARSEYENQTVVSPVAKAQQTSSQNPPLRLSVLMQYFRMSENIEALSKWKDCDGVELLVNSDSHEAGDLKWLNSSADRVLFSANVHEIRAYNALSRIASAPLVAFVQDDATAPVDCSYLDDIEHMMSSDPHLGVIGWRTFTLFPYFHRWRGGHCMEVSFTVWTSASVDPLTHVS